jgi:hypothetical protein
MTIRFDRLPVQHAMIPWLLRVMHDDCIPGLSCVVKAHWQALQYFNLN